jgi:hypothetical protein
MRKYKQRSKHVAITKKNQYGNFLFWESGVWWSTYAWGKRTYGKSASHCAALEKKVGVFPKSSSEPPLMTLSVYVADGGAPSRRRWGGGCSGIWGRGSGRLRRRIPGLRPWAVRLHSAALPAFPVWVLGSSLDASSFAAKGNNGSTGIRYISEGLKILCLFASTATFIHMVF